MKAIVKITLKDGILDPQGKAVEKALQRLDFQGVENVRQGKWIEMDLQETNPEKAKTQLKMMCEKLLANTVIENYSFALADDMQSGAADKNIAAD